MFYEYLNILNFKHFDHSCQWFKHFTTSEYISINENIFVLK